MRVTMLYFAAAREHFTHARDLATSPKFYEQMDRLLRQANGH